MKKFHFKLLTVIRKLTTKNLNLMLTTISLKWLREVGSNHRSQIQSLVSYH